MRRALRQHKSDKQIQLRPPIGGIHHDHARDMVNFYVDGKNLRLIDGYSCFDQLHNAAEFIEDDISVSKGAVYRAGKWVGDLNGGGITDYINTMGRTFLFNGSDHWLRIHGSQSEIDSVGGIHIYKGCSFNRTLVLAQKDSLTLWYGEPNHITGVFKPFDLSTVGSRHGHITSLTTLKPDLGDGGGDDALAIFISTGEILIYGGSGPNADNWVLRGIYRSSPVIAAEKDQADPICVTEDGLYLFSELISKHGAQPGSEEVNRWVSGVNPNDPRIRFAFDKTYDQRLVFIAHKHHESRVYAYNSNSAWTRLDLGATLIGEREGRLIYAKGAQLFEPDMAEKQTASFLSQPSDFNEPGRKLIHSVKPVIRTPGVFDGSMTLMDEYETRNTSELLDNPTHDLSWQLKFSNEHYSHLQGIGIDAQYLTYGLNITGRDLRLERFDMSMSVGNAY